jgi:signal peptidase I
VLRVIELCVGAVFVIAWALTLRPASLGGPATYVVVRGDSMLPGFHSGDLAILQTAGAYGQGDVIGYRVPKGDIGEGQVVLHRIVAGDGLAGYVMEGDNNPAPDPWLPRAGDVAGVIWLLLPGLGRAIVIAHQPAVAGAFAVSILVMVVLARRPTGPQAPRQEPVRGGIRFHRRPRLT